MFVVVLFFFGFLFSPSFVGESSLFLLLFKLMLMSMGSIDVVSGDDVDCFVAVVDVDDCVLVVVSLGVAMIAVVESFVLVVWFSVGAIDFFMGVFSPLFFLSLECTPPHLFCWGFLGDFRCFWWVTWLL